MPRIQAPDGTLIDFPDSMDEQAIAGAMGKLYPRPPATPAAQPRPTVSMPALSQNSRREAIAKPAGSDQPGIGDRILSAVMSPFQGAVTSTGRGLGSLASRVGLPGERESLSATAADLIEGGAGLTLPMTAPRMLAKPVATAVGGLVGTGASKVGEKASEWFGGSPDTQRLTGDVTGAVTGPLMARGLGAAIRKPAPMLARSALGIRGQSEAYGAKPGEAILEETSGIRPETVESSARQRLGELNQNLETVAKNSTAKASLKPARDVLAGKSAHAAAANSEATPRELSPMREQLTEPRPGFQGATEYPPGAHTPISFQQQPSPLVGPSGQPISTPQMVRGPMPQPVVSEEQSPADFLGMKRQFDKDFIRNWSPAANTKGALGVARQAYGSMAGEFNRAVPEAAPLNQRIQSLVPVAERARLTDMNAGIGERMLNRAGRPTGGLFPLLFGYHEGGIPGALAAIGGTEGVNSPEAKLFGARTLWGAGKGMGSPAAATGARFLPLVRKSMNGQ